VQLNDFLEKAWQGYTVLTPDAAVIQRLLSERRETLVNDHVALRTFNIPGITRFELGRIFEQWGYRKSDDELDFPEKKLLASYWLPPSEGLPKIFISELLVEKVSPELRTWIQSFAAQGLSAQARGAKIFLEPSWPGVKFADYQRFYAESEYAAWTAAFGIRVNHFTVFVNALKSFRDLPTLNAFLQSHGMTLNSAGGVIKGTPKELLEQSSTVARKIPWKFADGTHEVMGCYYEFARRYEIPGKTELFQGFIPKSADKIFESTFESSSKNPVKNPSSH
jgi:hypothetical protein